MKIRIDEVGYENYTGQLGMVDFVDGVSVNEVSQSELNRMAVVIRVVNVESEEQVGSLVDMQKNNDYTFPVEEMLVNIPEPEQAPADSQTPTDDTAGKTIYSREQLEALADKEGIAGLREVAETFGVKGTSIVGLIQEILDAQALKA